MSRTITLLTLGLLLATAGCSTPTLRDKVAQKRTTLRSLDAKLEAARSGGTSGYLQALKGGKGERAFHVMMPPSELARAAKALLPYSFDARSLHKDVRGLITVRSASGFKMGKADRFTFRMFMQGSKLKYTGSTMGYGSHIKKVKAGLQKGMDVDVRAHVWVERGRLMVRLLATSVRLRKNASKRYHSMLKGALNKYLFKKPFVIQTGSLRAGGHTLKPFRAMVTGNHIVVSFK